MLSDTSSTTFYLYGSILLGLENNCVHVMFLGREVYV